MYEEIIRQKLINARDKAGYTQEELSEETGIPYSIIAKIESGHRKPDVNTVGKLAEFYEIDINWFYGIGKQKKAWNQNNHKILELIAKVQFCKEIKNNSKTSDMIKKM